MQMRKLDTENAAAGKKEIKDQWRLMILDTKQNKDMREQFVVRLIDTERKLWTNDAVFYKDNLPRIAYWSFRKQASSQDM